MISEEQINDLIKSNDDYSKAYFIWQMDEENTDIEQFYIEEIKPNLDDRVIALMQHTGDMFSDCEYAIGKRDWLVLTDDEANEAVVNYAQNSLDDLLYGTNDVIKHYFNSEEYIEDYISDSDRGSILASQDGCGYEETINGITSIIYITVVEPRLEGR